MTSDKKPVMIRLLVFAVLFAGFIWLCVTATEVMSLRMERFWYA